MRGIRASIALAAAAAAAAPFGASATTAASATALGCGLRSTTDGTGALASPDTEIGYVACGPAVGVPDASTMISPPAGATHVAITGALFVDGVEVVDVRSGSSLTDLDALAVVPPTPVAFPASDDSTVVLCTAVSYLTATGESGTDTTCANALTVAAGTARIRIIRSW